MQENNYVRNKVIFKEILKMEEALDTLRWVISEDEALKVKEKIEEFKNLIQ